MNMKQKIVLSLIISVIVIGYGFMTPHPFFTVQAQEAAVEGKYASVNGLNMYYEIHGSGQPLILLHGGLGGIVEYSQLLQPLAQTRQVIAVELQGHGHTADIDRPMSYEQLADDVAALITELGFENVDVMGFSLGGGVALQTAIRHPEVLNKLVLVSTTYKREDMYAEFRTGMEAMTAESAAAMVDTPMYQFYSSVAPKLEDWPTLIGKLGEMLSQDYDWSADVASIKTPTLIVVGDSDMLHPAHAVELFGLLGGGVPGDFVGLPQSQLAVLPATSHFSILYRADLLLPVVVPFLDAPSAQ